MCRGHSSQESASPSAGCSASDDLLQGRRKARERRFAGLCDGRGDPAVNPGSQTETSQEGIPVLCPSAGRQVVIQVTRVLCYL